MPSPTSLTLLETLPANERSGSSQNGAHEPRETADYIDTFADEASLPTNWTSSLNRLKNACERAAQADRERRALVTQACQHIAILVGEAGLHNQPLPRDYEVRVIDRRWILVRCCPDSSQARQSKGKELREVRYVASGEESLWTRFNLQTGHLTERQIGELIDDLEAGLIDEMVDWVEARTVAPPATPATNKSEPHRDEIESGEPCRLRLVDLGRPRRGRGVGRASNRAVPMQRTA